MAQTGAAGVSALGGWRLWVVLLACAIPVQMTVTASPFLNGAAMDARHLDPAQIGAIRTAEILTNALLQIWLSARITRFSPRWLAIVGVAAIGIGNAICVPGTGVVDLAIGRILAGFGAGCAAAAMGAFIAQTASPHRVAAGVAIPVTIVAIVTALIVGRTAGAMGQIGAFGVVAVGAAVGLALTFAAPGGRPHAAHTPTVTSMFGAIRKPFVLSCFTIFMGSTAVWHFFERIGVSHGLAPRQIGDLSAAVGVGCALLAPLLALIRDKGVRWAGIAALVGFGIGSSTIPLSTDATTFAAGFLIQSMSFAAWSIISPAISARLDRTGGLNAAGNGWTALGNALSPAVGGAVIQAGGFAPLGLMCVAASVLTVTFMVIATRNLPPPVAATRPDTESATA